MGAIVDPFKYICNKTSPILTRYTTLAFLFCFLPHIPNTSVSKTLFYMVILKLARNLEKFYLAEAFVVSSNIDIFCMPETFLDSSVDNTLDGLNINGYTLVQSNHTSNTKLGGVTIYYKDHLPLIRRNGISSLNESIFLEIRPVDIKCFLTSLNRSVS